MRLREDERKHLKLGATLLVGFCLLVVLVDRLVGPGIAVSTGCAALSIGVEWYQKVRGEGTPSKRDAAIGAAPGVAIGLLIEFVWRAL